MISIRETDSAAKGRENAEFLQLHISLMYVQPEIWRRLVIPATANFGWLHGVIQLAMGWTNSHLHHFVLGSQRISDPLPYNEDDMGAEPALNEHKTHLHEMGLKAGQIFMYEYDFGDSWLHRITVEPVSDPKLGNPKKAVCVGGAQACPPEDCGGLPGFENFLAAMKRPKHPEHKSMKKWYGQPFDADAFSVEETNHWLGKMRWPKTTESALRKLILR